MKIERREFQKRYGLNAAYITTYVKRGKLIIAKDGTIDDENIVNADFIKRRKPKATPDKKNPPPVSSDEDVEEALSAHSLGIEKTKAEIRLKNSAEKLNQLKIAKQEGESIPTQLVFPIIAQMQMSTISAFKNGWETMLIELSHKHKLSNDEVAKLRSRMTGTINAAVKDAVKSAKMETKNIANTFANTRGVGERK